MDTPHLSVDEKNYHKHTEWEYFNSGPRQFYLMQLANVNKFRNGLDLGCGYGGNTIAIAEKFNAPMTGVDLSSELLSATSQFMNINSIKAPVNFLIGDNQLEKLPSKYFDFILCVDVLEHVKDVQTFLFNAQRVLSDDGVAVFVFPSIKGMFSHHYDYAINLPFIHHILGFDRISKGLNYLAPKNGYPIQGDVVSTPFHPCINPLLN